jgi:hypothetical protein
MAMSNLDARNPHAVTLFSSPEFIMSESEHVATDLQGVVTITFAGLPGAGKTASAFLVEAIFKLMGYDVAYSLSCASGRTDYDVLRVRRKV